MFNFVQSPTGIDFSPFIILGF